MSRKLLTVFMLSLSVLSTNTAHAFCYFNTAEGEDMSSQINGIENDISRLKEQMSQCWRQICRDNIQAQIHSLRHDLAVKNDQIDRINCPDRYEGSDKK